MNADGVRVNAGTAWERFLYHASDPQCRATPINADNRSGSASNAAAGAK
jgi:hypothetical protein